MPNAHPEPDPRLADRLAALALELIRIPSPSGEEAALADRVESLLRDRTRPAFLRRHGNALVAGYGPGEPRTVLAGHLDTVPANRNPEPARVGDEVLGLGATDMKGALAVMLALAGDLAPAGPAAEAPSFGLVFYDCEEVAFDRNGLRRILPAEPWLGRAGLAVLMEPTGNAVELGCLGTLHARVTFHGAAAHSARPWTGDNAIHKGAAFIREVAAMPPREVVQGPAVFREVINVTLAEGGTSRNVIPDRFTVNVNLRFAPDRSSEAASAHLRSLVPEGAEVEIVDLAPAAPARVEDPAVRRLIGDHGLEARAKQAWTDAAQFALLGVPAVNFGPGTPELAHQREERVPVPALVRSYRVLLALLTAEAS